MQRRTLLTGMVSVGTLAIAGCSDTTVSDGGIGRGIHQDYEHATNIVGGTTYIDINWRTWFDCAGYGSLPDDTVTLTLHVHAAGDVKKSIEWSTTYDDCMDEQERTEHIALDGEYGDILITTEHDQSD